MTVENLDSWLRENKEIIAIVASIFVIAIIVIIIGYQFDWTGFNTSSITAQTNAPKGTTLPTNITVTLPSKTLYDWLQLLIVPFVIAVAGYVINLTISRGEQEATEQRDKTERDIALNREHEATLKEYMDKMTGFILHENLSKSQKGDEVRNIAFLWTAQAVTRLDTNRQRNVIEFLKYSKLIEVDNIIDLNAMNLSSADLTDMNLSGLNFSGIYMVEADLTDADLTNANLTNTDLTDANLTNANLTNTDFSYANLSGVKATPEQLALAASLTGTIMPDGSKHD